jgi:hypothetical protein
MPDVSKIRVFEEEAGFGKPGATLAVLSKAGRVELFEINTCICCWWYGSAWHVS